MRCPKCKQDTGYPGRLEQGLVAEGCKSCGGHWVSSFQYWRWRDLQSDSPPPVPPGERVSPAADSEEALLCSECHRFLLKYRVARDVPFRVDHCAHCGGMWFDAGEWQALREQGLHASIHHIFTAVWQRDLRREHTRESFDRLYRERFGAEAYAEISRIREWLDAQPERAGMLRFLGDPNPFE